MYNCPADMCFSLDNTWQKRNYAKLSKPQIPFYFAKSTWDPEKIGEMPKAIWLKRLRQHSLSTDKNTIHGVNSGYGALNLAYLMGYKTIYLLGFDMNQLEKESHWHGGYDWFNERNKCYYKTWASEFIYANAQLNRDGVKVYNCNPDSKIVCFDKSITYGDL